MCIWKKIKRNLSFGISSAFDTNMLSTKERVEVDIIGGGAGAASTESNDDVDNVSEADELDLFPGGLELPPMRSPRGWRLIFYPQIDTYLHNKILWRLSSSTFFMAKSLLLAIKSLFSSQLQLAYDFPQFWIKNQIFPRLFEFNLWISSRIQTRICMLKR